MTASELVRRVTLAVFGVVAVLTVSAACLAGTTAAFGVLSGGVLAGVNFHWLVARVRAISVEPSGHRSWLVGAGLRFILVLPIAAALLMTGRIDPIGFLVGISVLPCTVIAVGLHGTRVVE